MSWKRTLFARQPTVLSVTRTWMVSVLESVLPVEVASIEAALAALDRQVAARDGDAVAQERVGRALDLVADERAAGRIHLRHRGRVVERDQPGRLERADRDVAGADAGGDDRGLRGAADVVARHDAVVALGAAVVEAERLHGGRRDRLRDDRRVVELLPELEVGVVLRAEIAGLRRAHVLVERALRAGARIALGDAHAVAEGDRPQPGARRELVLAAQLADHRRQQPEAEVVRPLGRGAGVGRGVDRRGVGGRDREIARRAALWLSTVARVSVLTLLEASTPDALSVEAPKKAVAIEVASLPTEAVSVAVVWASIVIAPVAVSRVSANACAACSVGRTVAEVGCPGYRPGCRHNGRSRRVTRSWPNVVDVPEAEERVERAEQQVRLAVADRVERQHDADRLRRPSSRRSSSWRQARSRCGP